MKLVLTGAGCWGWAFGHCGRTIFEVFKYLKNTDIGHNQPASLPYPTENPFA